MSLKKLSRSDFFLRLLFPWLFIVMEKGFWHIEVAYVVREKMERQQHWVMCSVILASKLIEYVSRWSHGGLTSEFIDFRNPKRSYTELCRDKPKKP